MHLRTICLLLAGVTTAGLSQTAPPNQTTPPKKFVSFSPGATSAILQGTLAGNKHPGQDYLVKAKAGQTMNVVLTTTSTSLYFNVLPPDSETALVNTSTTGKSSWTDNVASDGDYTVRVYLMRAAARKNVSAKYTIKIGVADAKGSPMEPNGKTSLAGTAWQLLQLQSMDDKILKADDPTKYTIAFGADGRAAIKADCNRGAGAWTSKAASELTFGPIALTRAMCPPSPLNDRFTRDLSDIRSFTIKDGHLFLSLMADGGIYEFEPTPK